MAKKPGKPQPMRIALLSGISGEQVTGTIIASRAVTFLKDTHPLGYNLLRVRMDNQVGAFGASVRFIFQPREDVVAKVA